MVPAGCTIIFSLAWRRTESKLTWFLQPSLTVDVIACLPSAVDDFPAMLLACALHLLACTAGLRCTTLQISKSGLSF